MNKKKLPILFENTHLPEEGNRDFCLNCKKLIIYVGNYPYGYWKHEHYNCRECHPINVATSTKYKL